MNFLQNLDLVWRILIALGWIVVGSGIAIGVWLFGMLMFAFSLDGASASKIPHWLELFVLVGWPLVLGVTVVVPAVLVGFGIHPLKIGGATAVLAMISFGWIFSAWCVVLKSSA